MVLLTCPERPVARSAEIVPEADLEPYWLMVLLTCPERPVAWSAELVPEADHHSQHAQAHHDHQVHHLIGRHPSISNLSKEELPIRRKSTVPQWKPVSSRMKPCKLDSLSSNIRVLPSILSSVPDPWHLVWIRIRGSMPLTKDPDPDPGSGSCYLCHWLSRWQQKIF